eukprot:TRINITY_DN5618_c0_g1_i5.p1 TRINITY_DN5618_c0_g1~~TRINITY_DN5618_c0_g1_i5.p1  ORF type:complete len:125 (-),score=24.54 TRINITY_DN5618_c0_g1_i5:184-558(-)
MGTSATKRSKLSNTSFNYSIEKTESPIVKAAKEQSSEAHFDETKTKTDSTDIEIPEEIKAISEKVNTEDFNILQMLGRGTFGKVMLVEHVGTGKLFALKTLRKSKIIKLLQVEHTKSERRYLLY